MFFDELTFDEVLQAADFERERADKRAEQLQAQHDEVQKDLDALKKNP